MQGSRTENGNGKSKRLILAKAPLAETDRPRFDHFLGGCEANAKIARNMRAACAIAGAILSQAASSGGHKKDL
jgi:hypothetical protein